MPHCSCVRASEWASICTINSPKANRTTESIALDNASRRYPLRRCGTLHRPPAKALESIGISDHHLLHSSANAGIVRGMSLKHLSKCIEIIDGAHALDCDGCVCPYPTVPPSHCFSSRSASQSLQAQKSDEIVDEVGYPLEHERIEYIYAAL